jgi:hypothetical protein
LHKTTTTTSYGSIQLGNERNDLQRLAHALIVGQNAAATLHNDAFDAFRNDIIRYDIIRYDIILYDGVRRRRFARHQPREAASLMREQWRAHGARRGVLEQRLIGVVVVVGGS